MTNYAPGYNKYYILFFILIGKNIYSHFIN